MFKKENNVIINNKINPKLLFLLLMTGVVLIVATYAWLSVSLNVKIKFVDLKVSSDSGLFISLDGIDYSDSVTISANSVIHGLRNRYPANTNQWASGGLWPVSSNGIKTPNDNKFDVYAGQVSRNKDRTRKRYLHTKRMSQDTSTDANVYIAFDIFLKNVSGSPFSDNLYLDGDSYVDFEGEMTEELLDSMSGILNSMRFGFVKMNTVSNKSDARTVQNIGCNNACEMLIFEPNSLAHSNRSIDNAKEYGITLIDGVYFPTYAIIAEGDRLEYTSGHEGTNIPLDEAHFKLQNTQKDFDTAIFKIANGTTKIRVYVWIEGQDLDSLETNSDGAAIYIAINFVKDLAGYE